MTTRPSSAVTDTKLDTHPRRDIPDAGHHPGDLVRYHLRVVARNAVELEAGLAEEWSDRVGSLQIAVDDWRMDRDAADWVAYWIEGRARP